MRDVRLVMDGPVRGALAAMRVDAVIVGGGAVAGRLGYLRGGVRGPALLGALLRPLEARALTIAVGDIGEWDLDAHRLRLLPGGAGAPRSRRPVTAVRTLGTARP